MQRRQRARPRRQTHHTRVALATAALLALDPSFLFVSRHDWGSVSLAMLCRGGGLWLAVLGWRRGSAAHLSMGGLLLGLGIYNKIDFVPFLAGWLSGSLGSHTSSTSAPTNFPSAHTAGAIIFRVSPEEEDCLETGRDTTE